MPDWNGDFVPHINMFLFPKTFPTGLRNNFGSYSPGNMTSPRGPLPIAPQPYRNPFAPVNTLPVTVIYNPGKVTV